MTAPSKLAVEIAEAIEADIGKFGRMKPERIQDFAALIDAKIRPLVEDGARMRKAIQRIRMMCSEDYNEHDPFDRIAPACMEALKPTGDSDKK